NTLPRGRPGGQCSPRGSAGCESPGADSPCSRPPAPPPALRSSSWRSPRPRPSEPAARSTASSARTASSTSPTRPPTPATPRSRRIPDPEPERRLQRIPQRWEYDGLIGLTAREHEVEPALVKAVIAAESNFDPEAVSQKGAQGLMQIMPVTATILGVEDPLH